MLRHNADMRCWNRRSDRGDAMKRTIEISLYKNIAYGYETYRIAGELDNSPEHIALGSGFAEIEIIDNEAATVAEVEKLREIKSKTLAEQCLVIERIDDKIQSLLAIGHEVQS